MDAILVLEDTGDVVYKKKLKRKKKLPVPDSPQADLLGTTVFEKQAMNEVDLEISEHQDTINYINHLSTCKDSDCFCLVSLHLSVTRYLQRCDWWLQDDEELKDMLYCNIDGTPIDIDDIPKIRDYQISSYWHFTKKSDADTYRFINARCKWAKKHFENRIEELKLRNECIGELGERW